MHPSLSGRALILATAFLVLAAAAGVVIDPADAAGPGGADIGIKGFQVQPDRRESSNGSGQFTLVVVLENRGNATGTVRLSLSDRAGAFFEQEVEVPPGADRTITRGWRVNGTGSHNATATLSGENATAPLSAGATCELAYVPVENPSPWYTIPCAFLAIILPCVVVWLVIRRLSGTGLQRIAEKRREDREHRTEADERAADSGKRTEEADGRAADSGQRTEEADERAADREQGTEADERAADREQGTGTDGREDRDQGTEDGKQGSGPDGKKED